VYKCGASREILRLQAASNGDAWRANRLVMPDLTEAVKRTHGVNWPRLLDKALTLEGSTSGIYNRFAHYSFGNQMPSTCRASRSP
jgi:hypothetical protein